MPRAEGRAPGSGRRRRWFGQASVRGEFTEFELSRGLAEDATRVAAAGRETDEPAFIAYELGEGLVIRTGTPQWARELDQSRLSVEVPQVTNRIWRLLSGGSL